MPDLTEAQKRALEWLRDDGWRVGFDYSDATLSRALTDLAAGHPDLAERKLIRNGRVYMNFYRLTPAGIALKAQIGASNA